MCNSFKKRLLLRVVQSTIQIIFFLNELRVVQIAIHLKKEVLSERSEGQNWIKKIKKIKL